jgi:hypothetical protein
MRNYLITIVMHDGSHGTCRGLFRNDWEAIDAMLAAFHEAKSIKPRRVS